MGDEKKTILYIDDDYQAGLLCKVFLEKAGFLVEIVLNTIEARKVLSEKKIDMVITDIGLPGENGVEFYKWMMTSKYNNMPVLIVSAHAMGFSEVLTEHRDIFFEKPIFFPTFIDKIKEVFNSKK
ncbi:MAG: response regulator [Calditrichaeota bacterium]|nr:MAG: response regulator [Calditrichota bacterium]MBL1206824.1 response regulator [Calditrichota bacterium]NOG46651.1 response regulator [Calditrichota bacterium]